MSNIHKEYGDHVIFSNFSLKIEDGDFLVITGRSGSGKTTLLNLIGGVDTPERGSVLIDDLDTKNRYDLMEIYRERIGFLFQNFALVDNKTVQENLMFVDKKCRTDITIHDALKKVGLTDYEKRLVYTLSGGEQQRVAVARLFIKKCDIILADEPTGNLDQYNSKIILDLIKVLNEQGKTIIMVTHDEKIKDYGNKFIDI